MNSLRLVCDFFSNESEKVVLGISIESISKKKYEYIITAFGDRKYLYCGAYDFEEYLRFIKSAASCHMSFEKFKKEVELSSEYLGEYKRHFFSKAEIFDQNILSLLDEIDKIENFNVVKGYYGFDGLSLTAFLKKQNEEVRFGSCYYGDVYVPVANLANLLLNISRVDSYYRFRKCK